MASLEQELQPGEWFIFAGRAHWIRYLLPAVPAAFAGVLFRSGHTVFGSLCSLLALAITVPLLLETIQSRFIVTNRRVILKRGLLKTTVESVPLADISLIELQQDGIGQWLKAGRIRLETVDGKYRALPWMRRARTFRRLALEQQRAAREAGPAVAPAVR